MPAAVPSLWQIGFRPFYLLASAFAALSIGLWSLQFAGRLDGAYLQGPLWHAHEMLFGFALAVVVGFLLTAGANWSGRSTLSGAPLAALAGLWIAGRVLVLTPFAHAAAAANVAFPLAAAVALAVPFVAAKSRRNYFFVALLLLLSAAVLAFHLDQLGGPAPRAGVSLQLALDVLLFIMVVMAGRVVPMFTNNGVPGARASRRTWLDNTALASVLALLAADALQRHGWPLAMLAGIAAVAHAARLALWRPWATGRVPLVWILHAGYAWIVVHLALRALAEVGRVAPSTATHALTVGAAGSLIVGMMTRTARGHTGRPLRAGRAEVVCFALVSVAALVRVGVPLVAPTWMLQAVLLSGALWSAAFALYFVTYLPVLTQPRIDAPSTRLSGLTIREKS